MRPRVAVAQPQRPEQPEFFITRLTAYLTAIGAMRQKSEVEVPEFSLALQDVTQRQLRQDLADLGFSDETTIPLDGFARAIRSNIHKARIASQTRLVADPELPSVGSFLDELTGHADDLHARRARAIETAFEFASHEPSLFLLGHGLFATEGAGSKDKGIVAYKHQIEEARVLVEQFLAGAIVVHEVGLGKTFTAILVLCELLLRNPKLTTLTLVPANLRKQWQKEFARSVDLPIYSGTIDKEVASKAHILLAIDTAKEERLARILTRRKWSLLIVDEGHMLRHDHTARYVFAYSLRAAHRILLTATPVHNSAYDIFHQANVVRPGLLGTKVVFTETYVSGERRVSNPQILQERLARVVRRIGREATGLPFPRRKIKHVLVENRSTLERALYDDVLSVLRGIYRRHLGSAVLVRRPSGTMQGLSQIVLVAILVLRELASHPRAAIKTLAGPLVERVKRLAKITGDGTDYEALEKIVKRYSNRNWTKGTHSKTDLLVTQIPGLVKKHGRVIIYVEFREAQKVIVERLEQRDDVGLRKNTQVISYHGGLTLAEKDHQLERFDEHHSVCFVSTDAGGQGLNLQQGNAVVNFDFPWNPMRVEQRIGRVDRLEQKAPEVVIRNFITTDTIEQYVYQTLRKKLKVCEDVLGHLLPPIFALRRLENPYTSEDDVLGIGQIILSSENDEDLRRKFLAFDEEIDEQFKRREGTWRPERRWIDG